MKKVVAHSLYGNWDKGKIQFGALPKNERILMRKFLEKGFEYCRCWSNSGDEMHQIDAAMFGVSPDRLRVWVMQVVRHITGAQVIKGLQKRKVRK